MNWYKRANDEADVWIKVCSLYGYASGAHSFSAGQEEIPAADSRNNINWEFEEFLPQAAGLFVGKPFIAYGNYTMASYHENQWTGYIIIGLNDSDAELFSEVVQNYQTGNPNEKISRSEENETHTGTFTNIEQLAQDVAMGLGITDPEKNDFPRPAPNASIPKPGQTSEEWWAKQMEISEARMRGRGPAEGGFYSHEGD